MTKAIDRIGALQAYVGKRYHYTICGLGRGPTDHGLTVHVRVIDAKEVYGHIRVCITPATDGSGSTWVNVQSLGREVTL